MIKLPAPTRWKVQSGLRIQGLGWERSRGFVPLVRMFVIDIRARAGGSLVCYPVIPRSADARSS